MAFTVETGAGLSSANSYVSVADADEYHSLRDNTSWAALTNTQKQSGLLYATAYVDANFNWPGYIKTATQSLDWPRLSAQDNENRILDDIIPQKLKDAVCELALVHASTEKVNATFDRGGAIKSESVGPVSVEYFDSAPAGVTYPFLEAMLSSLIITGSAGVIQLVRS